jgi:hypothetical protein
MDWFNDDHWNTIDGRWTGLMMTTGTRLSRI